MSQQFYAVVQDARMGTDLGITTLALVDRSKTKATWWTSDDVFLILKYRHRGAAEYAANRLKRNNARVVPYDTACEIIAKQQKEILAHEIDRAREDADDEDLARELPVGFINDAPASLNRNSPASRNYYDDDHPFSEDAFNA